ncbi:MAG TPA: riboflavin synthase [Chitinophagales bacterium]|nr:riboflavin synthase [Chitinophagales bacterium]
MACGYYCYFRKPFNHLAIQPYNQMFTGIIEVLGKIISIHEEGSNRRFIIESSVSSEVKIDQSVSHDGVCLTVVNVNENRHEVIAVEETLKRSNLGKKKVGDLLNLERSMIMGDRIDGHIVQGHVDDVAICKKIKSKNGSWLFEFRYDEKNAPLLVDKGSVCINGVSLTVLKPSKKKFAVAIIPYSFENTNFHLLKKDNEVNLEFDIIGKYVSRFMMERE